MNEAPVMKIGEFMEELEKRGTELHRDPDVGFDVSGIPIRYKDRYLKTPFKKKPIRDTPGLLILRYTGDDNLGESVKDALTIHLLGIYAREVGDSAWSKSIAIESIENGKMHDFINKVKLLKPTMDGFKWVLDIDFILKKKRTIYDDLG